MADVPVFRKQDRYKTSSFHSYNFKMPSRYDTCIWLRVFQVARWDRALLAELLPQIASLQILDVGCATGRLLEQLAAAGATQLAGADLAPRILEVARKRLLGTAVTVDLRAADAEDHLPWDSSSFDVVTLTGVLHHFYRPREALAEIHRVLHSGGRLLICDPWFPPLVRQLLNATLRLKPHDGDYRFYSAGQAAELIRSSGFEVFRSARVGALAYLITGTKPQ